ncbi:MAG TPA: hypothetical protein ENO11_05270, partial [Desulfobacteraceae bacterium]|nr:hypothetical protein [Desulfobacteraceae bacterium]
VERKKILLAQVPEIVTAMEHSFFHRAGFDFLLASDRATAMSLVEEEDPVLVIVEADSTLLDGVELGRMIKSDPFLRNTHILLIVSEQGQAQPKNVCDAVIVKPFEGKELVTTACDVLGIVDPAAPRKDVKVPVLCGRDASHLRPAHTFNLSTGGVFVETADLLPVDTAVLLELSLPAASLLCRGRVAWVNHPEWIKAKTLPIGMGIEFTGMAEEARSRLAEHLDTLPE